MNSLPTGWAAVPLGQAIELKYGKALPERDRAGVGFPVYGSNGIVGRHTTALTDGPTVIVGRKGSVGEVNYSVEPCFPIDTTYFVDKFPAGQSRFWFYKLRSLNLGTLNKSTAIPGFSRSDAYAVGIELPPSAEQKRIADKLDTVLARVDACRERLGRVGSLIKRFRQSVLAAATSGRLTEDWRADRGMADRLVVPQPDTEADNFTDTTGVTFDIPLEWGWGRLDRGITEASYGTSSKSAKTGAMPVLRMGNLQAGRIDWSDLVYSSSEGENRKYLLERGDVLFNRTNSPELVGKTSIYLGERPAIYAGYLIRVKCNSNVLRPNYLNYCLNSPYGRAYCRAVKSDGVSQSNINAEKLRNFPVPYCDADEQEEIVARVEALLAFADRLEARFALAQSTAGRLTPAVLAKAFRGELVPQDPNDEPAAELLKRLHDGRERAAKGTKSSRSRLMSAVSHERDSEITAV